jgi:hypothetical protein
MQGVCPGMCHNCDKVLLLSFCRPIPMLSMLGIWREGRHDGWIIEIVDVYCSSSICHDLLACILSTRSYEPCKHILDEFVFCWLTYILRVEWVLTCRVCVVAINCVQTSYLLEERFEYHSMHELDVQYPL